MIHISKDKKGFRVTKVGKNGEVLSQSESLKSKASCWKNIKAELKSCYNGLDDVPFAIVQDNTRSIPLVYYAGLKRVVANGIKPQTPYKTK